MKKLSILRLCLLLCLVASLGFAQTPASPITYVGYRGGFDIGAQGIKLSIMGYYYKNNKLKYRLVYDRQESVGIVKGMETNNGKLRTNDIQDAIAFIQEMRDDAKTAYNLQDKDFVIYVSSGVNIAPNVADLNAQAMKILNMPVNIGLTAKQEATYGARASMDRDDFDRAVLVDVGGGSSKGGFLQKYTGADNKERYTFKAFSIDFGARRLNERVAKRQPAFDGYLKDLKTTVADTLGPLIRSSFGDNPGIRAGNRNIIYMTGGAAYQFITWLHPESVKDEIVEFQYSDLQNFNYMLQSSTGWTLFENRNFDYVTDKDLQTAMMKDHEKATKKVYTRDACLAGITLILEVLKQIENPDKKIYYFSRDAYWINTIIYDAYKADFPNTVTPGAVKK